MMLAPFLLYGARQSVSGWPAVGTGAIADLVPAVGVLIRGHDFYLPLACVIDAGSPNGKASREWTGLTS
ncbi:hypothetical protein J2T09_004174 [Neorhizobium huautlense]|uniref:Uncharacterized protein n=1 Tax=Neorhizobium huautlense TaxID=67774 RepID=A0ABT9PY35_9HYPH|nr:hypothetical protein [Neorhizobium huautlense]